MSPQVTIRGDECLFVDVTWQHEYKHSLSYTYGVKPCDRLLLCVTAVILSLPLWMLSLLQWHQLELGLGLSREQHPGWVRYSSPGICPSVGALKESHLHGEGAVYIWITFPVAGQFTAILLKFWTCVGFFMAIDSFKVQVERVKPWQCGIQVIFFCTLVPLQVMNIRKLLNKIEKPHGLYPNFLSPVSGNWVQRKYSALFRLKHLWVYCMIMSKSGL